MNPKWLNFRNVNGIPYYMNEEGNWVSQFNGIVLTEQELTNIQTQGMMYMDDGWDTPPEVIFEFEIDTASVGSTGHLHDDYPARPRNHFKDYNTIEVELTAAGGRGAAGEDNSTIAGDSVSPGRAGQTFGHPGGGAGGFGTARYVFDRSSGLGLTFQYVLGPTYSVGYMEGATGYGITAHTGQGGLIGSTGALGGTAHIGGGSGGGLSTTFYSGETFAGGAGEAPSATSGGAGGRAHFLQGKVETAKAAGVVGVGGSHTTATTRGVTPGAGGGGGFTLAVGTGHEAVSGAEGVVAGATHGGTGGGAFARITYKYV